MKSTKEMSGITLIALVITIIILLILAGISIATLTGENGLLSKATTAKKETEEVTAKERIQIEVLASYDDKGKLLASNVITNITKNIPEAEITGDDFPLIVMLDGYTFEINGNGNVKLVGPRPQISGITIMLEDGTAVPTEGVKLGTKLKISFTVSIEGGNISGVTPGNLEDDQVTYTTTGNETEVKFTITGQVETEVYTTEETISLKDKYATIEKEDIIQNRASFYGAEVTGYETDTGVSKWRIFHADDSNIYLIADNYITYADVPKGQGGTAVTQHSTWEFGFNNMYKDYEGGKWIQENSLGAKWLKEYLTKNLNGQHNGVKVTAYLMDTNVWSKFVDTNIAEYVIGGPTVEMYCASYKETHPSKYIEYTVLENGYGYNVKWNSDSSYNYNVQGISTDGEFGSIYQKSFLKATNLYVRAFWLSSPAQAGGDVPGCSLYLAYSGGVSNFKYNPSSSNVKPGLRPVVCLKSDASFIKKQNGGYEIMKK